MAETIAQNSTETAPPPVLTQEPAQKRPVGRPPKPRDLAPPAPSGPEPGQDGGEDPDFFEYIKTFPAAAWSERLFMYLYRTAPFINLGKKGEWRIEKYSRPVDSQQIMEAHGSGGYKIIFDEWNPITNQTRIVRTHYFTIVNMNHPPRVPLGDWINKPENAEWLWARPALEAQLISTKAAANGDTSGAAMFKAAVDAVKELRPDQSPEEQTTLAQLVIQAMNENNKTMMAMANPTAMITMVGTVIDAITSKNSSGSSDVMALVTGQLVALREELSEERKFGRELLNKIMNPPAPPVGEKKSLLSEVRELKDTMEELGFHRGGSGASKGTDWAGAAMEIGREFLKGLTVLGTAIVTAKANPPRPQAARPAAVIAKELNAAAEPGAPAEPANEGDEHAMQIQHFANQYGPLFDTMAPFLVDQFMKNFSGMEFREWFKETYGSFTYQAISAMDQRTILEMIELRKTQAPEHVQALLQQLTPPEKVLVFLGEFLSDAPIEDDDDEPPEQEPEPAPRAFELHKKPKADVSPEAAASFVDSNQHQEF